MSNSFAAIVLYSWPLLVFILFRRLSLREALIWTFLAGYLLLPLRTGFDLPGLPPVDKNLVAALSAALMCYLVTRQEKALRAVAQRSVAAGMNRKTLTPS